MISTKLMFFFKFLFCGFGGGCNPAALHPGCAPERKYWIHNVSRASAEEGEFRIQFGRLKNERQKFVKYFRMSIWKFEKLKQLLRTDKRRAHDRDVA
jgi:hypothetical protein